MITPKGKMRINLAVADYIKMFPDEYKQFLVQIAEGRDMLQNEMAELKGTHSMKRALATMPEKLFQMIQKKLDKQDMVEWYTTPVQRWFLKEYPAFRLTKLI